MGEIKYKCMQCGYSFSLKEGSNIAVRCQYCGSESVQVDKFDLNKMIEGR